MNSQISSATDGDRKTDLKTLYAAGALLAVCGTWAYWSVLLKLWDIWSTEPDYSHGFLVPIFTAALIYMNLDRAPKFRPAPSIVGLGLLFFAGLMLIAGDLLFVDSLLGWSLVLWIMGSFWTLAGWGWMKWAAKYLAFLIFMVPIPFRLETALSGPLQRVATNVSTFQLTSLTLPAIAEGNTIYVDDIHLNVVEACSGLRMCMSITAMAFAFILLYRRPIWYRVALLSALAPIAILANSTRITTNGLLLYFRPENATETYNHMAHDWSGYAMIPMAAALFFLVIYYLDHLFVQVDAVKVRDPISSRRRRSSGGTRSSRSNKSSSSPNMPKAKNEKDETDPNETELDDPQDEPQLGVAPDA
jgi:exosortase